MNGVTWVQPLFDSFIAFRSQGLLVTLPLAAMARLKRAIKSSRNMWPLVQRFRRSMFARNA
jgi:CelD/BcsL family acetyltransferase involved in cellulose biosynthesis